MTGQDIAADVVEIDERAQQHSPRMWPAAVGIDRLAPHQQVAGPKPACWEVDPEVFFGPADSPSSRSPHPWEQRALAVCAHCPVMRSCLAKELEFPAAEQYGVIGGMTAAQRRATLRASRRDRRRGRRSGLGTLAERGAHQGPRPARP